MRSYNGMPKRPHNNKIVKKFMVTTSTLLQSVIGYDEETYAKEERYNNLEGALQCLIQDANFELPAQLELKLF